MDLHGRERETTGCAAGQGHGWKRVDRFHKSDGKMKNFEKLMMRTESIWSGEVAVRETLMRMKSRKGSGSVWERWQ